MNDQDRAALAIRTAADLLTTAAALVELDEKADALRHLHAVRDALNGAAEHGENWGEVARVIDAALAPTLAPGLGIGAAAFSDWQQQAETPEVAALLEEWADVSYLEKDPRAGWSEVDYMANGEECPDVYTPDEQPAQARARAEEMN